jgi:hypothetical protein
MEHDRRREHARRRTHRCAPPTWTQRCVPILIVQGGADTIVAPDVPSAFVDRLRTVGETVDDRTYENVGHLETGVVAVPDVVSWVAERFAGANAPSTCSTN